MRLVSAGLLAETTLADILFYDAAPPAVTPSDRIAGIPIAPGGRLPEDREPPKSLRVKLTSTPSTFPFKPARDSHGNPYGGDDSAYWARWTAIEVPATPVRDISGMGGAPQHSSLPRSPTSSRCREAAWNTDASWSVTTSTSTTGGFQTKSTNTYPVSRNGPLSRSAKTRASPRT